MKVIRSLNNNAVAAVGQDGREVVLVGPGMGFGRKPGDPVDEAQASKVYSMTTDLQNRLLELLEDIDPVHFEVTEAIVSHARECGLSLKDQVLVSLADHIAFAIERLRNGTQIPFLMLSEVRMSYPREFEVAEWGRQLVNRRCGIELPEDETAYIALQLVNASLDQPDAYRIMQCMTGILRIVEQDLGAALDERNLDSMRLITHVRFLAQRVFGQLQWDDDKGIDGLRDYLLAQNPSYAACVDHIRAYLLGEYGYELQQNEEAYLLVHLGRIFGTGTSGNQAENN